MSRERERYDFDEIGKKLKREIDASNNSSSSSYSAHQHHHHHQILMGRTHMLGPPGTLNMITPCAACKLLRRRCAQECPFSPYFSPHEPHKFASVHKVFGASNVSKMLMEVPESQRADAANSLVYEANVRLRDPVYGCMGAISALQQQVQSLQAELNAVRGEILKYKYNREANNNNNNLMDPINPSSQYHHHHHQVAAALFSTSTSGGAVSVASLPPSSSTQPPPPPPPPPLPPPTSSSAASSSMYTTQPKSAADYSTLSSENVSSYFG